MCVCVCLTYAAVTEIIFATSVSCNKNGCSEGNVTCHVDLGLHASVRIVRFYMKYRHLLSTCRVRLTSKVNHRLANVAVAVVVDMALAKAEAEANRSTVLQSRIVWLKRSHGRRGVDVVEDNEDNEDEGVMVDSKVQHEEEVAD